MLQFRRDDVLVVGSCLVCLLISGLYFFSIIFSISSLVFPSVFLIPMVSKDSNLRFSGPIYYFHPDYESCPLAFYDICFLLLNTFNCVCVLHSGMSNKIVFIYQSVGPLKALYSFCPPLGRPVHSDTNLASPGCIIICEHNHL